MAFDNNFPLELIANADWPMESTREWLAPEGFEFPADLEKRIIWSPGHALMNLRGPGPSNNYGIHGMEVSFVVIGDKGATNFNISLGWVPRFVNKPIGGSGYRHDTLDFHDPMAFDLGYHAEVMQWEGQDEWSPRREDCHLTRSHACYYDGSGLQANALFDQFVMTGDENVVWQTLVERYNELKAAPPMKELTA